MSKVLQLSQADYCGHLSPYLSSHQQFRDTKATHLTRVALERKAITQRSMQLCGDGQISPFLQGVPAFPFTDHSDLDLISFYLWTAFTHLVLGHTFLLGRVCAGGKKELKLYCWSAQAHEQ